MYRWLSRWLRPGRPTLDQAQAHMTFGHASMLRTAIRARLFLKKQLWVWPIIALVLLSIAGYAVSSSINRTMRNSLKSELETLLSVERAMLGKWMAMQESNAQTLANNREIRRVVFQLATGGSTSDLDPSNTTSQAESKRSELELQAQLRNQLEIGMSANNFVDFVLVDRQQHVIASLTPSLIGQITPQLESVITKTLEGEPTVSVPFPSVAILKDRHGRLRAETPTMFVTAPVRDDNLQVIAVLAMRIRPEREFTEIIQLGRLGETGETYAVDRHGLMVSNSRFDEQLMYLGVLPDTDFSASILKVQVRDPGGDLTNGYRQTVRRSELPLTKICEAVISGTSGINLVGYRDYRGLQSVGAWTWLPKYEIGLITEINSAEAFHPLTILNWSFYSLYAMLVVGSIAIFVFTLVVARLQREAQKAAIDAKQLGQYRLETLLGAGAMGVVYKGHHAMLRRPTAIKMLQLDKVSEVAIGRFEREVQITCSLNHPSTIAIYDYGRTPEGVFYYAMEYLDGIDLQSLVDRYGPQPEGRVVQILQQVCGSLYEAHSQGLVHRDIKPANIMLNRRGGESDVVKVLDFGLVKSLDDSNPVVESTGISGTPLYMSPESIQSPNTVDGRSDLYSLGAVGYFLLTGETVFHADSLSELCKHHLATAPEPISQRIDRMITVELESAILACLEKSRAKRPQTARDLSALLKVSVSGLWTQDDADAWWGRHEREVSKTASGENALKNSASSLLSSNAEISKSRFPQSDEIAPRSKRNSATSTSAFDQTISPDRP